MSDPPDPPRPVPLPAGDGSPSPTLAARGPRPLPRRRPLPPRRVEPAATEAPSRRQRKLETLIVVVGFALFGAHLAFGRTEFDILQRFLVAIPVIPLFWELYRYHKLDHRLELPAGIFALLLYYVTFSLSAFFDTEFTDLSGPVTFTDEARLKGTAAVALGSIMIYAGFRLGEKLGVRLQPLMIRLAPPAELPDGFVRATAWFCLACMATTQILVSFARLPAPIAVLVSITFSYSFGIGITVAKPEMFRGARSRHISAALLFFGGFGGIIRGMLDPIVRLASTTLMARWGYWRRLSRTLVVGTLAIYVIIQPIKAEFRAQMWTSRGSAQTAGYSERIDAWVTSFEHFWSGREAGEETKSSALGRLMELDPIMHAFMFLPGRVQFAEGAGWLNILYAPIPRLFWADKPTTDDFEQRYSVVFNRQTKEGARSTSILLPLVIDGYWNFGWGGVVFVTFAVGLWVGVVQKMYAVKHWAIQAMGVAQLSELVVCGSLAITYSGITQHIIAPILSSWIVYWLAKFLSVKETFKASGQVNRLAARRLRPIPQRQ